MRLRFDQIGKRIGRAALGRSGTTVVHDEIAPDAQHADLRHEPDPARAAEHARLGLLGRLAAVPCLIEIFGHAPSSAELRACLGKHIAWWQQRARRARGRRRRSARAANAAPFLWIIAAGTPVTLLRELSLAPAPEWPAGVYLFGRDVLRVGVLAARQLPLERSTLLVRLMAGGPLLPGAIEELGGLPPGAPERAVADQILVALKHAIERKPNRTRVEEEFVVKMYTSWDVAAEDARSEAQANDLLTVLRVRGIRVPATARKRILAEKRADRLQRWLERAAIAESLEQVLDARRRISNHGAGRRRVAA